MRVRNSRLSTGLVLSVCVASTTAAPVALDTEQRAAAGVAAGLFVSHEVPYLMNLALDPLRRRTDLALATIRAQVTPEALMAARGGIRFPCATSGSFTARMANALPRVLKLNYEGCVGTIEGYERTLRGPVAITLVSDSFQPERLASIRFGNAFEGYMESFRITTAEQIDTIDTSFDLSLQGDISSTRAFNGFGSVIGTSSYQVQGRMTEYRILEFPDGRPTYQYGFAVEFKKTSVIESRNLADGGNLEDESLQVLGGSLAFIRDEPAPYGTSMESYRFNGLTLSKNFDWVAFSSRLSVNGPVNISWNRWHGYGCVDGQYNFRTRAPLVRELNSETFKEGELAVNGSVLARFYNAGNVPRRLPVPVNGMLFNLKVDDLGTFNYDTASIGSTLSSVGACISGL